MGVVTLLQLLKYFMKHPPLRNVVFNINNGEEDWLNGAHVCVHSSISLTMPTLEHCMLTMSQVFGASIRSKHCHISKP